MSPTHEHCRNCNALLSGEYCSACGQREGRADLYFGEAVGDILGEVVRWDSRLWRTLIALLLRPGFLSAEFNAGRRVRYMPPFRLYLVLSFLTFLIASLMATVVSEVGDVSEVVDELRDGIAEQQTEESALVREDSDDERIFSVNFGDDAPQWIKDLELRINANAARVGESPNDYLNSLREHLPQMMFLMLPLFALILRALYLFSPFHYLQHLVFALHYHSFVFLLYLTSTATEKLFPRLDLIFGSFLILYLPLALRRCYRKSWFGTLWRAFVLTVSYSLLLVLGFAVVAVVLLAVM